MLSHTKNKIKYPKSYEDQVKLVLIVLKEKSRTRSELFDVLKRLSMQFGANIFLHDVEEINEFKKIDEALKYLKNEQELEIDEQGVYTLTALGLSEAETYSKGMYYFLSHLSSLTHPSISPLLSLIVHIFLGFLKIFGYFVTGSVSLLSDGLDSTLDGVSAIVVGISMKIKKEIYALYLLLFLMILTGIGILLEGFDRLVSSRPLEDEMTMILIALLSIIVVGMLYVYQRFSGYKNRNLTILAQSEDSKNHILNASLVFIVAIAGNFGLYFIDGLVAMFIGFIILNGAFKLSQDIRKQEKNEVVNYEKYKLGMWKKYDKMQSEMLKIWILYSLKDSNKNINQLIDLFNSSFSPITIKLSEDKIFSLNSPLDEHILTSKTKELIESGLLIETNSLYSLSDQGKMLLINEISKEKHRVRPFGNRKTHFHK